ncbi:sensor histidine kinase [Paenibacillus phocaensis]|uniref:sensor histidine kinase n=1 Tax=Paenibacillus phocaensis TaxID=1776378 RepID=UPI000839B5A4|nr:sensor histidine kinase [Paenibacillus phocaensis]
MERWSIGNRWLVLGLAVALIYAGEASPSPWLVLFVLLYLALDLTALLLPKAAYRNAIYGGIVVYSACCAVYVNPEFVLLLPLSAYETARGTATRVVITALLAIPLLFLEGALAVVYAFIVALSLLAGICVHRLLLRLSQQEEQLDKLRLDQQKLRKQLHGNQEFIRASEYTFKLEERNRLSQEIHDSIGHSMTGALIQMEAAKRVLHPDPAGAEKLLQNAIGIAQESIEQIRQTLKNMKPPVEQLGIHRLRNAVEAFGSRSGLQTSFVHSGELEQITPLYWKVIHDNVTEALTNTAKYGEATSVQVEVRVLGKWIQAVVTDNGRGQAKIVKGMGLLGMEERTAAVNGTVIADGSHGFKVTTLIPYVPLAE